MNTKNLIITIIGVIVVIGLGVFLFMKNPFTVNESPSDNNTVTQYNFRHDGNLVKDNPGFAPGSWYLSYEQEGSAALSKELDLGSIQSVSLQKGMRVHIEGDESNGVVKVATLRIISASKDDLIWVSSPLPNQVITSPVTITGQARGNWYFEASFPVTLLDANGKILAQAPAQATGEWMTTNYVPFKITLTFTKPTTATGTLVLHKDNPSGLPQNDNELRIPVSFEAATQTVKLYYYNASKDKDASGNIMCSAQGLVAVERSIPVTQTPIQDTIKLLLQEQLTAAEKSQGLSTEYPLTGFSLKGASVKDGTLTLEFADPQNKTGGGSCRVGILWKQIETTAKQFSGISKVVFIPAELFQP